MKKLNFCIYPQKDDSGKIVYFYSSYDENGRVYSYSTGTDDRREAQTFVMNRVRSGNLIPDSKNSFKACAKDSYDFETNTPFKDDSSLEFAFVKEEIKQFVSKFNFSEIQINKNGITLLF